MKPGQPKLEDRMPGNKRHGDRTSRKVGSPRTGASRLAGRSEATLLALGDLLEEIAREQSQDGTTDQKKPAGDDGGPSESAGERGDEGGAVGNV